MAVEVAVAPPPDRRLRRRQETIEEVLDVAATIMAEHGVAGLSLGEIARRMGMRPPSLYVYFPSKDALYDALFARGARRILEVMTAVTVDLDRAGGLEEVLLPHAEAFVRWTFDNRAYSQLLFWRPVPGFAPSADAYAPALELIEAGRARFAELQRRGLVRDDVSAAAVQRDWTIVISGVVSQQLSNAPGETYDDGRFTRAIPGLVSMFARHYAPPTSTAATGRSRRGAQRADQY